MSGALLNYLDTFARDGAGAFVPDPDWLNVQAPLPPDSRRIIVPRPPTSDVQGVGTGDLEILLLPYTAAGILFQPLRLIALALEWELLQMVEIPVEGVDPPDPSRMVVMQGNNAVTLFPGWEGEPLGFNPSFGSLSTAGVVCVPRFAAVVNDVLAIESFDAYWRYR